MGWRLDVIVLDTSPLLLVPDTRVLQNAVEGVLLVVSAHRTPRNLVAKALNLLDPSKFLGTVFKRDDSPLPGYYGYSGYYGHHGVEAPSAVQRRSSARATPA